MHGKAFIAAILQFGNDRIRAGVDILLVADAALRQEGKGISREKLIFGVGRTAAEHRRQGVAADRVIAQRIQKRHDRLVRLKAFAHHAKIRKGLVHDHDDRGAALLRRLGELVAERLKRFGIVVFGLSDDTVANLNGKVEHEAVDVHALQLPLLGDTPLHAERDESGNDRHRRQKHDDAAAQLERRIVDRGDQHQKQRQQQPRAHQRHAGRIVVAAGNIHRRAQTQKIRRQELRAAEGIHIPVHSRERHDAAHAERAAEHHAARDQQPQHNHASADADAEQELDGRQHQHPGVHRPLREKHQKDRAENRREIAAYLVPLRREFPGFGRLKVEKRADQDAGRDQDDKDKRLMRQDEAHQSDQRQHSAEDGPRTAIFKTKQSRSPLNQTINNTTPTNTACRRKYAQIIPYEP